MNPLCSAMAIYKFTECAKLMIRNSTTTGADKCQQRGNSDTNSLIEFHNLESELHLHWEHRDHYLRMLRNFCWSKDLNPLNQVGMQVRLQCGRTTQSTMHHLVTSGVDRTTLSKIRWHSSTNLATEINKVLYETGWSCNSWQVVVVTARDHAQGSGKFRPGHIILESD